MVQTLCTGALALLAPVTAWARPRKRHLDLAAMAHSNWQAAELECQMMRADRLELLALIAEARERIEGEFCFKLRCGQKDTMITRIDTALGRAKGSTV